MNKKKHTSSTLTIFNNVLTLQDNARPTDVHREWSNQNNEHAALTNQVLSTNYAPHKCWNCTRSFSSSQALGGHQNAHRNNWYSVQRELLFKRSGRMSGAHHSSSSNSHHHHHHQIPYNYSFPNIHSSLVADTPSSITPHPLYYGLDHGRHHHHHRVHAYGSDYNHSWLSTYCNARSAQRTVEMRDRVFPAWLTEHHENRVAAEMRSRFNVVDQAAGDHHQPLIEFVRSGDDGGDDGDDQVAESAGGGDHESGEVESGDGGLDLTLKL